MIYFVLRFLGGLFIYHGFRSLSLGPSQALQNANVRTTSRETFIGRKIRHCCRRQKTVETMEPVLPAFRRMGTSYARREVTRLSEPVVTRLPRTSMFKNAFSRFQVQEALDQLQARQKRTTLTVAHRLTTIMNSDKIAVLNGGGCRSWERTTSC